MHFDYSFTPSDYFSFCAAFVPVVPLNRGSNNMFFSGWGFSFIADRFIAFDKGQPEIHRRGLHFKEGNAVKLLR